MAQACPIGETAEPGTLAAVADLIGSTFAVT